MDGVGSRWAVALPGWRKEIRSVQGVVLLFLASSCGVCAPASSSFWVVAPVVQSPSFLRGYFPFLKASQTEIRRETVAIKKQKQHLPHGNSTSPRGTDKAAPPKGEERRTQNHPKKEWISILTFFPKYQREVKESTNLRCTFLQKQGFNV